MLKGLGAINQLRNRKGGRGGHQKDYTLITDYTGEGIFKKREDQL